MSMYVFTTKLAGVAGTKLQETSVNQNVEKCLDLVVVFVRVLYLYVWLVLICPVQWF